MGITLILIMGWNIMKKLQPIRIKKLTKKLENDFDCNVRQGKGSEIVIYKAERQTMYSFGIHKKNYTVLVWQLKECLRRLGISFKEFCES